ncbi:hypothetical protein, conserved [Plasmodium gonderi]|uniref:Sugar phosphate phosphatase n=1 Tax=Plasmodium gonderi TaxID=77519 RepID=A0A1Y1JGE2_PLAGO|nr:hypothetical protein, conserved [Plasmodium gonderi]GAW79513.1 hypothetical protein, conserved [Plasmodium gonderi]
MYFNHFYENFKDVFTYLRREDENLPPILTCEKPNTMENDTIVRRIPQTILKGVEEHNEEYTKEKKIDGKLAKIRDMFMNGDKHTYEMLQCKEDITFWNFLLDYFIKKNMKVVNNSWLFNEYYFYRYLSCSYDFENSNYDFFEYEKKDSINCNRNVIEKICTCAKGLLEMYENKSSENAKIFDIFFYFSLWSNQFDLSWNPTKNKAEQHKSDEKDIKKKTLREKKFYFDIDDINKLHDSMYLHKVLCNDVDILRRDITSKKWTRFDIVLDNMGLEFITDLCLLHFLNFYFDEMHIHVKKFPLFVSDTMAKDITYALDSLCNDEKYPNTVFMANKWKKFLDTQTWKIQEHVYWNLPLPYWVMPKTLVDELKKSSFVCFKGDANYRRCLGDLKFNFWHSHKNVLGYFPVRIIALRCLKSPICCGVNRDIVEDLNKKSPDWCNYGEYAILQYCSPEGVPS